jgi:hypothetical protein
MLAVVMFAVVVVAVVRVAVVLVAVVMVAVVMVAVVFAMVAHLLNERPDWLIDDIAHVVHFVALLAVHIASP